MVSKAVVEKRLKALEQGGTGEIVYPTFAMLKQEGFDYEVFMDLHNKGKDWRKNYRPLDSFYE